MSKLDDLDRPWTFLSNYAHVLVCLAEDPTTRIREVADRVGITERAAMRNVKHLDEAGVVSRQRVGRRNRYRINMETSLRHPLESHGTVGSLLTALFPARIVTNN